MSADYLEALRSFAQELEAQGITLLSRKDAETNGAAVAVAYGDRIREYPYFSEPEEVGYGEAWTQAVAGHIKAVELWFHSPKGAIDGCALFYSHPNTYTGEEEHILQTMRLIAGSYDVVFPVFDEQNQQTGLFLNLDALVERAMVNQLVNKDNLDNSAFGSFSETLFR